jgi:hypothetical protein
MQKSQTNVVATRSDNPFMPTGSENYAPPSFRLVAPVSDVAQDGIAKPGQWYSPELGIAKDSIHATLLFNKQGRILWTQGELGAPRCSSDDAITPRAGSEFEAIEGGCNACPLKDKECETSYALLFHDLDDDFTFQVRISSWSGNQAVRNMNSAIDVGSKGLPFRRGMSIQSVQAVSGKGIKYFKPQFLLESEDLPDDVFQVVRSLAYQYVGATLDVAETEVKEEAPKRTRRTRAQIDADERAVAVQDVEEAAEAVVISENDPY